MTQPSPAAADPAAQADARKRQVAAAVPTDSLVRQRAFSALLRELLQPQGGK